MGETLTITRDEAGINPAATIWLDTTELEESLASIHRQGRLNGDTARQAAKALELYQGDFITEELYLLWAEMRRQELKEKYLAILYRLGNLQEKQGAATRGLDCYKRVIQADPLSEPAYQRLMLLYAQRGMRSAALRAYEDCARALQKELDTDPDEVTTSIYRKIQDRRGQGSGRRQFAHALQYTTRRWIRAPRARSTRPALHTTPLSSTYS